MIVLRDVALEVGGHPLLARVDARFGAGEFVAVLGPNGVGKTTLLRAIAGLHPVKSGSITLDGVRGGELSPRERARRVAFVTGDEVLLDALCVRDVVSIGRFPHHRWWEWQAREADFAAVSRALAAVRMEAFADRLFSTLSAGERQRVWIALGLAQATPILILDEPTSHLDVRVAHEILDLLRGLARAGKSVLCALHDLNEAAAYADRIALLGEGTLLKFGEPDPLLSDRILERVYGIEMDHVRLRDGRARVFARGPWTSTGDGSAAGARPSQAPNV